ncbi:MAG: methylated-DNA--[protein]-cysteine S-methyltransferase, partial [Chryseobacterium sp.]|nr:methylated-DNA--[protein]-cysteine S-methyltransferase [Chryseobacterium sp.]
IIPCHRVVSKNNNIGGYAYGSIIKQKLLNVENCIK